MTLTRNQYVSAGTPFVDKPWTVIYHSLNRESPTRSTFWFPEFNERIKKQTKCWPARAICVTPDAREGVFHKGKERRARKLEGEEQKNKKIEQILQFQRSGTLQPFTYRRNNRTNPRWIAPTQQHKWNQCCWWSSREVTVNNRHKHRDTLIGCLS